MDENVREFWVVVYRWEYCLLSFIIFSQFFFLCVLVLKLMKTNYKNWWGLGEGSVLKHWPKQSHAVGAKRRDRPYYWQIFCEWPSLKCPGLGAGYQRSHNPIRAFREIHRLMGDVEDDMRRRLRGFLIWVTAATRSDRNFCFCCDRNGSHNHMWCGHSKCSWCPWGTEFLILITIK